MKRFDPASFVIGAISMLALLAAYGYRNILEPERCPYKFPHSGQCIRANHHRGEHW